MVLSEYPASSTTKTGRHDIAESGIKHNKSIKSNVNQFVEGGQDLVEAEEVIWTYLKYNVYTCTIILQIKIWLVFNMNY